MQYCRGGKKSKRVSPGSDFTEQIFTVELSGVDSAGVLRQDVIKFYFLTTKYFQIIYIICSSIVWQSASSSYCHCHLLSHSPLHQNFGQLFFNFHKVWGYPISLISWFINFNLSKPPSNFRIF